MTRRLHVAYVCADRGVPVGGHKGASLHVAELVRALSARRTDVSILASRVADPVDGIPASTTIVDVGGSRSARRTREVLAGNGPSAAAATEAAAVLFNQELSKALERLHRTWRIDAIYERYSLWSFAALAFAKAHGIPHLLEANAPLREEQKRYRDLENDSLAASLERYLLQGSSRVLVPSAALLPWAKSCGATAKAVHVVPNAADPARFRTAVSTQRRPARRDDFVIGFVGSLKPWHGLDDLAAAFRRLRRLWKGYRLLIVGDGPLRAELEAKLHSWGLADAVTFSGAIGHDDVPTWIARMDVAVAPYPRDAPGYFSPIKIFEYMAASRPIVASSVGQIAEVLTDRRSALLHRPGAIGEIVERIEQIRRRPALATKIAREARSLLVRRYTWTKNADRVLALVRAVQREDAAANRPAGPKRKAATTPRRRSGAGTRGGAR